LLGYLCVLLTLLALLVAYAVYAARRLSAPSLYIHGYEVERHPLLLPDPDDAGVRVTEVIVSSPAPVRLLRTRYTVQGKDEATGLLDGTHAQARAALIALGLPQTTWALTGFSEGAPLPPGQPQVFAAVTTAAVRSLARLEVEVELADALGRRLTKRVPALPVVQPAAPPVPASALR
jgi:hypothetical protein